MNVTPHVAQNDANLRSAIDGGTTRTRAMLSASASESAWRKCWLDENDGTAAENALPRTGENELDVHLGAPQRTTS